MTTTREQQLEAALRPFVDAYKEQWPRWVVITDDADVFVRVTMSDCRRAERALEKS